MSFELTSEELVALNMTKSKYYCYVCKEPFKTPKEHQIKHPEAKNMKSLYITRPQCSCRYEVPRNRVRDIVDMYICKMQFNFNVKSEDIIRHFLIGCHRDFYCEKCSKIHNPRYQCCNGRLISELVKNIPSSVKEEIKKWHSEQKDDPI